MEQAKGFIRYQIRHDKNMNIEYAYYCIAKRVNGKKKNIETWLGKVIDKVKHIFYNKTDGFFILYPGEEKKIIDSNDPLLNNYCNNNKSSKMIKRSYSIDFGDIFIFNEFLKSSNLYSIFEVVDNDSLDTLFSLIIYRILNSSGYSKAYEWWSETYANFIFPNANLQSQRISEFLSEIGKESYHRVFFNKYIPYLQNINQKFNLLIDSTGLKNAIKIPITAINNHNGLISNEIRLLVVADKVSGLPIFYRYVPGNIVDVSTLSATINELAEYNINIDRAILDAGYYSEDNIILLCENNIPFMTRLSERNEKFELIVKKYVPTISCQENLVKYGDRTLFIQKSLVPFYVDSIKLNCYICLDIQRQGIERVNYFKNISKNISNEDISYDLLKHGIFILVSSIDLEPNNVLPCYYDRQTIEQVFDYMKGYIDIIPLRCHTEETLAGHLFISFLASIGYLTLDKILKKHGNSLINCINSFARLHCRVYENKLIPDIATKKINKVLKILKLIIPPKIIYN